MLLQFPGDALGGVVLGVGQFGMGVQILVESLLASLDAFVTSQDLVDAVHTAVLRPERGAEGAPDIHGRASGGRSHLGKARLGSARGYLAPVVRLRHTSQPIPPITTRPATTMPAMAPAGRPPPAAATGGLLAWLAGTGTRLLGIGVGSVIEARADAVKATT